MRPSTQADVSAPEIKDAYDAVRNDKDPKTWLLLDYAGDRSDKLVLTATGEGDLDELKSNLNESNASFAYLRVKYANDVESTREKVRPTALSSLPLSLDPSCAPELTRPANSSSSSPGLGRTSASSARPSSRSTPPT